MTLRQLLIYYDSKILDTWDHTSSVLAMIYSLICTVVGLGGSNIKHRTPSSFHPYRSQETKGMKVTKKNIKDLKFIAGG